MKPLAVCAIFQNEARYLLEWLAYHSVIGFDRFVLYDNDSTDGGGDLVRKSRFAHRATVIQWPRRPGQLPAYQHFIDCHARDCEWVAFIDLDEFLVPLSGDSIIPLLAAWNGFSAALVQWRCFGPSGWLQRPNGLVIENYDTRLQDDAPVNLTAKSIVRCTDIQGVFATPHEFCVSGPVCDTLGRPTINLAAQPVACHDVLVLNHYITKSKQDWTEKLRRGSPDRDDSTATYEAGVFDHLAQDCAIHDDAIKRFAPRVRTLLAADNTPPDTAGSARIAHADTVGAGIRWSDGHGAVDDAEQLDLNVATRLLRLDPGLFSLALGPGPRDRHSGLPAARVSLPPGPSRRPDIVGVSPFRGDGWLTGVDEPTLIRVVGRRAEVLVTLYWSAADGTAPALRLTPLDGDAAPLLSGVRAVPEIVAHIGGIGDVGGRIGEWIGRIGGGVAIEGIGLTPRHGISPEDFEIRAVLDRGWLSPWLPGGQFCGSRGLALPLRGFCLRLRPTASPGHDFRVVARFIDGTEVAAEGADVVCASPVLAALEAVLVMIRPGGVAIRQGWPEH